MKNGLDLPVLAIDPGKKAGGAALLSADGKRVLKAWAWRERKVKGEAMLFLSDTENRDESYVVNLADIGIQIVDDAVFDTLRKTGYLGYYALVVEGLFVGLSKKESMTLSWAAGLVAAVPSRYARGELIRPTPTQWRPEVIGVPGNTNAKDAADLAIKWVAENLPGMGALADNEHACEAACQAVYGWRFVNGRLAA